jgi:hypothetical protein
LLLLSLPCLPQLLLLPVLLLLLLQDWGAPAHLDPLQPAQGTENQVV